MEYAASLWYMIHFDELRPHIRHWMASWFFLDRMGRKESDYQDDLVVKELNRYKSSLDTFMRFRKSQADNSILNLPQPEKDELNQRNEMTDSNSESST